MATDQMMADLIRENAQLKAALNLVHVIVEHDGADFNGCCASDIVAEATNVGLDGLLKLKAELAQAKRSYDGAVAAHHDAKSQYRDLIEAHRRELAGWEAAHVALDRELAQCQQDVKDAAGELVVPMPEPGTDTAKLLSANVLLRQRETRLREALKEIIEKCEDEDWEYMFGDIITRAKQALEEAGT